MISENDESSDDYTRKNSLRLQGFDYSSSRVYFVTINVLNRKKLFFNREFAKAVIDCLLDLRQKMQFNLYGYCLMPDHFHALIGIGDFEKDLGKICGAFKSLTTRIYWKYGQGQLWQRAFYDHIVRNETDFFECLKYIKENPLKKNLENWEFFGRIDISGKNGRGQAVALTNMKEVTIVCDGSSLGNGKGNPRAAAVAILGYKGLWRAFGEYLGSATNQQAEIAAARIGLEKLTEPCKVRVLSDSRYVVETMTGNFRKKTNLEWWAKLDEAARKHTIKWEWVKGHAGHEIQEVVDTLARKTAELGKIDELMFDEAATGIGIKEI